MTDKTLKDIIFEKVPLEVVAQLLFLDNWKAPADFFTMSKKERHELRKQYVQFSVTPTEQNYWIWFGQYTTARKTPKYNRTPVARIIYEAVVAPLTPHGLRTCFVESKADVNPHKYFQGKSLSPAITMRGIEAAFNLLEKNPTRVTENMNIEVNKAHQIMKDWFVPNMLDDREKMLTVLKSEGISEFCAKKALSESTLPFIG